MSPDESALPARRIISLQLPADTPHACIGAESVCESVPTFTRRSRLTARDYPVPGWMTGEPTGPVHFLHCSTRFVVPEVYEHFPAFVAVTVNR